MSVTTPDYVEAGHLLGAYGELIGNEGNDEGAQKALSIAMEIAKQERNPSLEMMTLLRAASVDLAYLRDQEYMDKCQRAIEIIEGGEDPLPGRTAYMHSARFEYCRANLPTAQRYAETFLTVSERSGVPAFLAGILYLNQKIAALGGEWQRARSLFERGLREVPDFNQTGNTYYSVGVQAVVEYAVGDFAQGEAVLGRLLDILHASPLEPSNLHLFASHAIAIAGRVTGTMKHFDVAREAAETVLASQRVSPMLTWFARAALALLAVQQGDTRSVQAHYDLLLKGESGERVFMLMDGDRLLGILTAGIGEFDLAANHFEAALAIWGKGGFPEHAWTAHDYADALLQRGQPGDRDRATTLLDEALSISEELGMKPLNELVILKQASLMA
jgi:tetratricopeptide (TPR) repeat protein